MTMKFLVMVNATQESESGALPDEKMLTEMMRFNDEMVKAGLVLDAAGLTPSSRGKRIRFDGTRREVIDGPFTESKELVAGYWLLQAKSLEEVVEWMKRCPNPHAGGGTLEIRPLHEIGDFPAATEEVLEINKRMEKSIGR
jgi:hypothetical protein